MAPSAAPWKHLLLTALHSNANLKHTSFFNLATIGSNGRPANRTVVFRGFQEGSDRILINTDNRTRKIEEIRHCPYGEFRINGKIEIVDGSNPDPVKLQQREKAWLASSIRSRLQYLGPSPGLPCINEEPIKETVLDPSTGPVDAFCLLLLEPEQVDYLNLKSNKRLMFTSKLNGEASLCWMLEEIHP